MLHWISMTCMTQQNYPLQAQETAEPQTAKTRTSKLSNVRKSSIIGFHRFFYVFLFFNGKKTEFTPTHVSRLKRRRNPAAALVLPQLQLPPSPALQGTVWHQNMEDLADIHHVSIVW